MGRSSALVCVPPRLDIEAPGVHSPEPPGVVAQQWVDHAGRLIATGGRTGSTWWMHWPELATFLFDDEGPVRARPARAGLQPTIRDSFVRGVTPVVLLSRGYEGLHASGIRCDRGLVGLVGASGTGKSTTAFALASLGADHFADDTVIYSVDDGAPLARRLPFPVRVESAAAQAIGAAPGQAEHPSPDTAPFVRIYQLVRDTSLDATRPALEPVSRERRFELLLAHAHPFDMGGAQRRRRFIESVMTLARDVDVWTCRFNPRLDALPVFAAALRDHIDRA